MSRKKKGRSSVAYWSWNPTLIVFFCAFALSMLGLTVLFSASLPVNSNSPYSIIGRQVTWVAVTLVVGMVLLKVNLETLRKLVWVGYGFGLALLGLVLIDGVGSVINGSRSWIRFGPVGIQPAEFAKIGLVFALAHYYSLIRREERTFWKGFVIPCVLIGSVVGLILIQTDLGTALIISLVGFCTLFLAGVRLWHLLPAAFGGFGLAVIAVLYSPERLSRLTAFLDMEGQKAGDAYQVWQAILAFGAGGFEGVGLGNGRQQLRSLPEAHNDFIFAIVGEELGILATMTVVTVFAALFIAGMIHLRRAPNVYQYLLGWGCLLNISVQAVVNLGVVTGCLPTTGLPLPFISYGGSNFLVMGIFVAILLNTSYSWRKPALKDSKRHLREI